MATSGDELRSQIMSDLEQIRGTMICIRVVSQQIIAEQTKSVETMQALRLSLNALEAEINRVTNQLNNDTSSGSFPEHTDAWEEACSEALGLAVAVAATSRLIEREHQRFGRLQKMCEGCMQTLAEMRGHVDEMQSELAQETEPTPELDTAEVDATKVDAAEIGAAEFDVAEVDAIEVSAPDAVVFCDSPDGHGGI